MLEEASQNSLPRAWAGSMALPTPWFLTLASRLKKYILVVLGHKVGGFSCLFVSYFYGSPYEINTVPKHTTVSHRWTFAHAVPIPIIPS